jgi:uncharacterized HAD superfamily protein
MIFNKLKRNDIRIISSTAKSIERQLFYGNPYFLSNAEVAMLVSDWCRELAGENYDLILGIPRSGMMIASMISLNLALPLSSCDNFPDKTWASSQIIKRKIKKILVVDDTVGTGETIKNEVKKISGDYDINTAAMFVSDIGKNKVDKYYKVMPEPILGEWNFRHQKIGIVGVDMDGVLCEDCPIGTADIKDKYMIFLKTAKRLYVPSYNIDFIITSRLEKYRKETEEWLRNNNVKYDKLIMLDLPDWSYRYANTSSQYKADQVSKLGVDYFIESGDAEAKYIWDKSHVPVICIETMKMYNELYFNNRFLTKLRRAV